jgi:phenylpyruvate tautomerase PptA (4-oxalocrotonate tautomerase family)
MSDQHGYGGKESLGEESRSVDSESAGRSHMDFFSEHPDDVAARERELVVDVSEVQADVLTPGQSSVPIILNSYNTNTHIITVIHSRF